MLKPTFNPKALALGLGLTALALSAFAQQPTPQTQKLIDQGKAISSAQCAVCHGEQGQSVAPDFPRLAGQNANYIAKQLQDFASGKRVSQFMVDKVAKLNADQMYALGVYFQSLKPSQTPVVDTKLAQVGEFIYERGNPHTALPACVSCHGTGARGTNLLPRLAGQHPDYLVKQVKAFKTRERNNDNAVMHMVAERVSDLELQAVSAYLGGLK